MPKVKFTSDIQSISGKLCSKEGVIYSVNQQTGETYRSDRHSYHDAKHRAATADSRHLQEESADRIGLVEAEPSCGQERQGHGGLPRCDEGLQGAAQDCQPLQLHALPRHRRPQGSPCRQRPHGWREARRLHH